MCIEKDIEEILDKIQLPVFSRRASFRRHDEMNVLRRYLRKYHTLINYCSICL